MIGIEEKISMETKKEGVTFGTGNGSSSNNTNVNHSSNGNSNNKGRQGLVALSDCPVCQGAVFRYNSKYGGVNSWEEKHLCQCIQCGRIFGKDKDGNYELWPKRSRIGKRKNLGNHSLYDE